MKKFLILLLVTGLITTGLIAKEKYQMPDKVKIIAITGTSYNVCYTIIDLSNNEIVIIDYSAKVNSASGEIVNILRTGIIVNPNDYNTLSNSSTPNILK